MAGTLIDLINEVFVDLFRRGNKSAISEIDQSLYIANRINEALQKIYRLKPFEIDVDGTVTITPSTRTFSGPTGVDLRKIHPWSLRIDDADGDTDLDLVTEEYVLETYPTFETEEADMPKIVYFTSGLIGVYPLLTAGAANLTMQFKYSTQFTKLTSPSATFPFKDDSDEMQFIKLHAKWSYQMEKGVGQPDATYQELKSAWATVVARHRKNKNTGIVSSRRIG